MKSLKNSLIIILLLISTATFSAPTWVAPYPTVTNINAVNADLNVRFDNVTGLVTIYYITYRYTEADATAANIKLWSANPPDPGTGPFSGGGSFTYNVGDMGTVKTSFHAMHTIKNIKRIL